MNNEQHVPWRITNNQLHVQKHPCNRSDSCTNYKSKIMARRQQKDQLPKIQRKMRKLIGVTLSLLVIVTMAVSLPTISRSKPSRLHKRATSQEERNSTANQQTGTAQTLFGGCNNLPFSSCKTLKQRLCLRYRAYRSVAIPRFGQNAIYPFFVHPELYYDHDNYDRTQSTSALEIHQNNTDDLRDTLNTMVASKGNRACLWNYSVTYNPNEFPAFIAEAGPCTLDSTLVGGEWRCENIMQSVDIVRRDTSTGCWENASPRQVKIGCQLVKRYI